VQLAPPTARALVPESCDLGNNLAAVTLAARLVDFVPTLRAIPDQPGGDARRGERAHRREPAVGAQVLPVLSRRVARPDQRVAGTGAAPAARDRQRKGLAAVF